MNPHQILVVAAVPTAPVLMVALLAYLVHRTPDDQMFWAPSSVPQEGEKP